jgi:hypothetical protein
MNSIRKQTEVRKSIQDLDKKVGNMDEKFSMEIKILGGKKGKFWK